MTPNPTDTRRFFQVDVFADQAYVGNPLAVVLDGHDVSDRAMQQLARWTNLSETTFVLPPTDPSADYRVRIFTQTGELPFAGHPTLGTCHAWLAAGGQPRGADVVQQCGIGLVRIRQGHNRLAFLAPPRVRVGPLDDAELATICQGLGIARSEVVDHAWCDNGPGWRGLLLRDAARLLQLVPNSAVLGSRDVGVVAPRKVGDVTPQQGEGADFEVRAFFPSPNGIIEDPVTGSLNAALAQWLIGAGHAPPAYVAAQGTVLGRRGRVYVNSEPDGIWIGGHVSTCIDGTITL